MPTRAHELRSDFQRIVFFFGLKLLICNTVNLYLDSILKEFGLYQSVYVY